MHLYLKESPRTIYLVTSSQEEESGRPPRALVVRTAENDSSRAVVELLHKADVELSSAVRLTGRIVKGCIGLISLGEHMFLAVVTSATEVGNLRPTARLPELAARIHQVAFFCLTSNAWDHLANEPDLLGRDLSDPTAASAIGAGVTANSAPVIEHPCVPLSKMLSSGTFYYALASGRSPSVWDISTRLSSRQARDRTGHDAAMFDDRFVWNDYIARGLLDFRERLDPRERVDFDLCQFLVLVIQGYVGTFTLPLPAPPTHGTPVVATLSLISRLGYKRAGTRFNTRGVDDDGNTANFVETEVLFCTDQHTFSYVQVRGSVPLFWEQQGLQTFGQKIQLTRPQASQPAFERHFAQLTDEYSRVHAMNLLGTKDHEAALTASYSRALQQAKGIWGDDVGITHFDFHSIARTHGHEGLAPQIRRVDGVADHVDGFGFTMCDVETDEIITEQKGVFRTNCLDCLDRTNFIQDVLSRTTLEQYLQLVRREWTAAGALWAYHRELWAENGDALSRIYAGTGALNTSFTRSGKRTLGGLLSDATKSVSRAYINNFTDKSKQAAIDLFLGNLGGQRQVSIFDPVHDTVNAALARRVGEYSSTRACSIYVGTWNLNGRPPTSENLLPWLQPDASMPEPDIMVIGFQEIVPLTAQQIVQTDPEKKRQWETKLMDTLARRPNKNAEYVLLRSAQLVGTALVVLARAEHTGALRAVEAATRKTGLRGMSGNKGAAAVRLELHATRFCFVTAHLAAGHANVEERNADYWTIARGLHFQRGRTIDDHDVVVWLADTNYRIDGDNEYVRAHALADDLATLQETDQLRAEMAARAVFPGYAEGALRFRPTYKYDAGTDTYDTSEKQRVPAWTDRILYKAPGAPLQLAAYGRAELRTSDHKPVYALFRGSVRVVDHAKKAALARLLADGVTATAPGETLDEKLAALSLDMADVALPPPSSEAEAWWETADRPGGVVADADSDGEDDGANPWDSDGTGVLSASPSSSDEELFNSALKLQVPLVPTKKAPPPPPPARKPVPSS